MSEVIAIPLERAVICEGCNTVNDSHNGHCAVCESKAIMNLAKILNRESSSEALVLTARDAVEEFKQLNKSLSEIAKFLGEEREASRELGDFFKGRGA